MGTWGHFAPKGSIGLSIAWQPQGRKTCAKRRFLNGCLQQVRPWAKKLYRKLSFKQRVAMGSSGMVKKTIKANGKVAVSEAQ